MHASTEPLSSLCLLQRIATSPHCTTTGDLVSCTERRACAAGLWLNIPDYDAPTQMVKPLERNTRYVDAVLTIPKVCRGYLIESAHGEASLSVSAGWGSLQQSALHQQSLLSVCSSLSERAAVVCHLYLKSLRRFAMISRKVWQHASARLSKQRAPGARMALGMLLSMRHEQDTPGYSCTGKAWLTAVPWGSCQGTLYPMCGMNLAFNRETIGPAMYFGLMGDGQPLGRYDDMWAGWCTKVTPGHVPRSA